MVTHSSILAWRIPWTETKEIIKNNFKIAFIECLLQMSFDAQDLTWIFI